MAISDTEMKQNHQLSFREMCMEDIPSVCAIEQEVFPVPWSEAAFRGELQDNVCARYYVAMLDDQVVGYGGMWLIVLEAHITNVAVTAKVRRMGIGEQLVKCLMQRAYEELGIVQMTLEVRRGNGPAQHLYRKLGFTVEGVRPSYYEDNGEDAYLMWCRNTVEVLKIGD